MVVRIGLPVDLVQDKIVLNRTERHRKRCFSSDESITQWGINVDKLMKTFLIGECACDSVHVCIAYVCTSCICQCV